MCTVRLILLCFAGVYPGWGVPPQEQTNRKLTIIGGTVTDITKVPYQAAVFVNSKFMCGAAIISKNFLLTAGHCCKYYNYKVRVGSNYYEKDGTLLNITRHYIHPKYAKKSNGIEYDVGLLQTSSDIVFSEKVKPVTISNTIPQPNDLVLVAGWGSTKESGPPSKVLMSVLVPVTNKTYCEDAYGRFVRSDMYICAGVKGKDSCNGDSGGGLVWNDTLVGVVSFGFGCGQKNFPGVYTNAVFPGVRKFIKDIAGV